MSDVLDTYLERLRGLGIAPTADLADLTEELVILRYSKTAAGGGADSLTLTVPDDEAWELIASSGRDGTNAVTVRHGTAVSLYGTHPSDKVTTGWTANAGGIGLKDEAVAAAIWSTFFPSSPVRLRPGDQWSVTFTNATALDSLLAGVLIRRRKMVR